MVKTIKPITEIVVKLLDFLSQSVLSEGGDGDALWYTRLYDLDDIQKIIEDYNDEQGIIWEVERQSGRILWGKEQEGVRQQLIKT